MKTKINREARNLQKNLMLFFTKKLHTQIQVKKSSYFSANTMQMQYLKAVKTSSIPKDDNKKQVLLLQNITKNFELGPKFPDARLVMRCKMYILKCN